MTGNDLSRLLGDGTPEPPRALSSDDLLRRARRRRTALVSASSAVAALATVVAVAVAVREPAASPAPVAVGASTAGPSSPGATGTPGFWPEQSFAAVHCVAHYPAGLADHPNAFDATVTGVTVDERAPDAASPDRRVTVELRVHRVFAGPPRETVRLNTWDFMLPSGQRSIVGFRILAAAGPELDLKSCGYTRPYSESDAGVWERLFRAKASDAPDDCGIDAQPLQPGSPDESRYVGMPVQAAVDDVKRRGLSPRLVGDGVGAHTDDYRTDRVTMCNRDGVITAAARF